MTIGELSTRSGRSIHTIRWYEAQGLIPGVVRDPGNRRLYSELHIGWLDLIDRLRGTGMSIAEIRAYTSLIRQGHVTLKRRREVLSAHRAKVERTIAQWAEALALIDNKIDYYSQWLETGERPSWDPAHRLAAMRRRGPRRDRRRSLTSLNE